MSLNYRIHWVDDDKDYPKSLLDNLELEFDDEVSFNADFSVDGDQIDDLVESEHLDLIVLDFNLENGRSGDNIIRRLREAGELTEIVFYSADPEVHEKCVGLDGVHVCVRDDAEADITSVVRRFVERNSNVSVMRGVIISEAIDVENRVSEIILALFGDKSDMFKRRIMEERHLDFGAKIKFINGAIKDLIATERKRDPVNEDFIAKIVQMKAVLATLDKEVVHPRNILAHAEKSVVDGILTLKPNNKSDPIKFDDDWKNQIRLDMKKHLQNLAKLKRELLPDI